MPGRGPEGEESGKLPPMTELNPDERTILDRLRQSNASRLRIPAQDSVPIGHPEKYANPIGIGSDGELFPQSPPPPPKT